MTVLTISHLLQVFSRGDEFLFKLEAERVKGSLLFHSITLQVVKQGWSLSGT